VPLADGRTVRGAAGALLPDADLDETRLAALRPLGLRIVHPGALAAGHGPYALLERLGTRPGQPRAILADPALRTAIAASDDAPPHSGADADGPAHPGALAEAVLTLVRAVDPRPQERFGLDGLLPDEHGDYTPARDLLLPSSPLAAIVSPDAFGGVHGEWVRRWGAETLRAVGVLDSFTLAVASGVLLDADGGDPELFDLDGFADWIEDLRDLLPAGARDTPPVAAEVTAVRDLDLVAPEPLARRPRPARRARAARRRYRADKSTDGRRRHAGAALVRLLVAQPLPGPGRPPPRRPGHRRRRPAAQPLRPARARPQPYDRDFLVGLGVRTTLPALLAAPTAPTSCSTASPTRTASASAPRSSSSSTTRSPRSRRTASTRPALSGP